jgi:hypothetical protein
MLSAEMDIENVLGTEVCADKQHDRTNINHFMDIFRIGKIRHSGQEARRLIFRMAAINSNIANPMH